MKNKDLSHVIKGLYRAALIIGVVAMVSGVYLARDYSTDADTLVALRESWRSSGVLGIVARLHYWSSFAMLVLVPFALAISIWSADWKESKVRWFGGLGLFLTCLLMQISGNVLPMDQHDARTMATEIGLAARIPMMGSAMAEFLRQGEAVGPQSVAAWFGAHQLYLSAACGVFMLVVLVGSIQKSSDAKQRKMESALLVLPIVAILATAFALPGPSGSLATAADFASNNAEPSWYVLPMHAMLLFFDSLYRGAGWIGMVVIPGIVGLAVATLPFWTQKMPVWGRRSILVGGIATPALLIYFFAGKAAPITGSQDIIEVVSSQANAPIDTALAEKGALVFNLDCAGCHGSKGTGTDFAPSVTGQTKKGHDRMWIIRFVTNPQAVRSGSTMPRLTNLSESQIEAVSEYVRSLP